MNPKKTIKDRSIKATIIMIAMVALLCIITYVQISVLIENRCIQRLNEGTNIAIGEINRKLKRDNQLLNATAQLIASSRSMETSNINGIIRVIAPLMKSMELRVLMPDNTVIDSSGKVIDANGKLSFEEEAAKGEHVTDRMYGIFDDGTMVIRHFVPIVKDGETVAMLWGATDLNKLPDELNIENIYNSSAAVFIVDNDTGDFIMDTWHDTLGNLKDFSVRRTKDGTNWSDCIEDILAGGSGYTVMMSNTSKEWTSLLYACRHKQLVAVHSRARKGGAVKFVFNTPHFYSIWRFYDAYKPFLLSVGAPQRKDTHRTDSRAGRS